MKRATMDKGALLGPAEVAIAFDLLQVLLRDLGDPTRFEEAVARNLRELTGARTVIAARRRGERGGAELETVAIEPARRRHLADNPATERLLESARALQKPALWLPEGGAEEVVDLLAALGVGPSIGLPLVLGQDRIGAVLLLDLPAVAHIDAMLGVLDALSAVIALGLSNVCLLEERETRLLERTAELQVSLERLEQGQRVARMGYLDWDLRTDRLVVSSEARRLFGLPDDDAAWTNPELVAAVVHPDDRQRVREALEAAGRGGEPFDLDHRIVRPDGTELWVHAAGELLRDADGNPMRLIGAVHDITERKRLEVQLRTSQRLEAIGRLAGGVAHDFNNILCVILASTEFLLDDLHASDPRRNEVIQIRKAGKRAASLTRQLLAFSRRQILQPKRLDLHAVVRDLVPMLRRILGEDIDLVTVLETEPGWVKADPGQIEQVVMNLVVNARDAMPDGGLLTLETMAVELDATYVEAHAGEAQGPHMMIAVTDTGVGMEASVRERIFEPFFTTKGHGTGTGLGLATVHGIVKQSGGEILVYSEPGIGTTFKVYLPRMASAPAEQRPVGEAQPEAAAGAAGDATILVIEDEEAVRYVTVRILKRHSYTVLEAGDGREALVVAAAHPRPIDLLLTDVVLPRSSGPEMAKLLVESNPSARVVYMSGYTDNALAHRDVLDPGVTFIQKPFTADALLRVVTHALHAS